MERARWLLFYRLGRPSVPYVINAAPFDMYENMYIYIYIYTTNNNVILPRMLGSTLNCIMLWKPNDKKLRRSLSTRTFEMQPRCCRSTSRGLQLPALLAAKFFGGFPKKGVPLLGILEKVLWSMLWVLVFREIPILPRRSANS